MIEQIRNDYIQEYYIQTNDKNTLDEKFFKELADRLESIKNDTSIKAVILSSKNEKFFSNGFEPSIFVGKTVEEIKGILDITMDSLVKIFLFPRPIVCAVNGHCMGVGTVLTTFCDYRIMATGKNRIGFPEALIGLSFPSATGYILKEQVGMRGARDLLYNAKSYKSSEAIAIGLVDEEAEPDSLLNTCYKYCSKFKDRGIEAIIGMKRAIRNSMLQTMEELLKTDNEEFAKVIHSYNGQEGLRSILEGRRPVFK